MDKKIVAYTQQHILNFIKLKRNLCRNPDDFGAKTPALLKALACTMRIMSFSGIL